MTIVAHISDLHFGAEDPRLATALLDDLNGNTGDRPALVAISGDLTQRARRAQFRAARGYLDQIATPYLVVPGNHDIPLFDVLTRFLRPRERYCRTITSDMTPVALAPQIAIAGIDTSRRFTIKDGRIKASEVAKACAFFAAHPDRWKILVAHHPFVVAPHIAEEHRDLVDNLEDAVPVLEAAGVDLVLSGHLHQRFAEEVVEYGNDRHSLLAVHAGTCISHRTRGGEPNGYNWLVFRPDHVSIIHRVWDGARFVEGDARTYRRQRFGSELLEAPVPVEDHLSP